MKRSKKLTPNKSKLRTLSTSELAAAVGGSNYLGSNTGDQGRNH